MAMFILMHWAVLLERHGKLSWWAESVGRNLVGEISERFLRLQSQVSGTPEWRDGIP